MDKSDSARYRIADGLKQLVRREPLDRITVKEITEAAGVSRKKFYL